MRWYSWFNPEFSGRIYISINRNDFQTVQLLSFMLAWIKIRPENSGLNQYFLISFFQLNPLNPRSYYFHYIKTNFYFNWNINNFAKMNTTNKIADVLGWHFKHISISSPHRLLYYLILFGDCTKSTLSHGRGSDSVRLGVGFLCPSHYTFWFAQLPGDGNLFIKSLLSFRDGAPKFLW